MSAARRARSGYHDAKIATYNRHPMGRSLFAVAGGDAGLPVDRANDNPFRPSARCAVSSATGRWSRHRRSAFDETGHPIYDSAFDVAYAIGSGAHGHSYLAVREGGYVVQKPDQLVRGKTDLEPVAGLQWSVAAGQAECHARVPLLP